MRPALLAGTGHSSTRRTIAQTRRAAAAGIDAALVVAPPYVRPTQEGLYRHFCEVADHGGLPVVLYNVPARTACDLLPETVARLRGHGNIVGIKEAVGDAQRMEALLAEPPDWLDAQARARIEGALASLGWRRDTLSAWLALVASVLLPFTAHAQRQTIIFG